MKKFKIFLNKIQNLPLEERKLIFFSVLFLFFIFVFSIFIYQTKRNFEEVGNNQQVKEDESFLSLIKTLGGLEDMAGIEERILLELEKMKEEDPEKFKEVLEEDFEETETDEIEKRMNQLEEKFQENPEEFQVLMRNIIEDPDNTKQYLKEFEEKVK